MLETIMNKLILGDCKEILKQYYKVAKNRLNGIQENGQFTIFANFNEMEGKNE